MSKDGLKLMTREQLAAIIATRKGETKLGERAQLISNLKELKNSPARFVLLGIKEDIGIRANLGKGGATNCWDWAIKAIVNVQSNSFLDGSEILVLGALEFESLLKQAEKLDPSKPEDLAKLRELTAVVDKHVVEIIQIIVVAGKIPIIIGGGHNNSYGNITGTAKALGEKLNVLNIDPHTDYRALEGRHSGNGFSYAREGGHFDKYAVYGLHEGYNSKSIIEAFQKDPNLTFQTFEGLLNLRENEKYQHFMNILNWLEASPIGLELDLDSITHFPVSALNPSGFSLTEVRSMIRATAGLKDVRYFHVCEGSPGRAANDMEREMLGKSVAYLVTDFVKSI